MTEDPSITFWFDASCPFTWRTSRWIRDVAARQGRSLQWQPMSLAILNEGKEIPEQYRQSHTHSRRAARLLIATGQRHGQAAVERLYTAIGETHSPVQPERRRSVVAHAQSRRRAPPPRGSGPAPG